MWKLLAAITTSGALLCAQLDAQPPARGPRPWWDAELAKNANLTDEQQKEMRKITREFRPKMFEVQQAVNKADADVAAAFNEEPVDQGKANDAINRLAAARAEMTRTVSQLDLKLRTILTAQQWQEMRRYPTWQDRSGGRRRGPGTRSTTTSTTTTNQK